MMKSANQIRQEFIEFFKQKKHRLIPSSPVFPQDDPTLLFTNAGMNQFKSIFLGENRPGLTRAVNSQKCMRVSGKHNDLEEVGIDHHHHTFFEMLGNWSFGDYYKKEVIQWAWELLTEIWQFPKEKLYATIYKDDLEAEKLWQEVTDIDHDNISKHGEKDNFWEMGETGPCGPCSEIHIDTGSGHCPFENDPKHHCGVNIDGCGRYIEIWNLVFIQFNREKDSSLSNLPKKHIDTGMGFERVVRIIQHVDSNYDTDVFMPIIKAIEKLSGKPYDPGDSGAPFRVIADHIRALIFSIADGVFPSNEGRGYVVRRLLRRAYRFGRMLDFSNPFLYSLVSVVVENMGSAFPEIAQRKTYIEQIIHSEEDRFDLTLEQGIDKINTIIKNNLEGNQKSITGNDVFMLYDTYGFPMDLTRLIASEKGVSIDEKTFHELMLVQKNRARNATKEGNEDGLTTDGWIELKEAKETEFVGFEMDETQVMVCRYKILEPAEHNNFLKKGLCILDRTPFYAEMGGQLGDKGLITADDQSTLTVVDTIKWNDMTIHKIESDKPFPTSNFKNNLRARIHNKQREYTQKNHSATHLLQSALIHVLGDHVSQSGSRVGPDSLRFDFTHFKALTKDEIDKIENCVNTWIWDNLPVTTVIKGTEQAKKEGATALFGEKYGERVRVVSMGSISKELCGGTHVQNTSSIGVFHIVSESSIAAGIRRIEAITGIQSLSYFKEKERIVMQLTHMLKINDSDLVKRVEDILSQIKIQQQQLADMSQIMVTDQVNKILTDTKKQESSPFPWAIVDLGSMDKKRFTTIIDTVSDRIREKKLDTTVIVLAAEVNKTALFAACAGKTVVRDFGIHCGNIVKAAAQKTGGNGGGSAIRAQAGGKDHSKLKAALALAQSIIYQKAGI